MSETQTELNIPTFDDVVAAHERIAPHIHRTPVLTSTYLNGLTGAELFFKCENFQKAGAFKARGACNAVFGLDDAKASKGVVMELPRNLGTMDFVLQDTRGQEVERGTRKLGPGVHRFSVPPSGLIRLTRRN